MSASIPTASTTFGPVAVELDRRADGSMLLRSRLGLSGEFTPLGQRLAFWANTSPERTFLLEREGSAWRSLSYGEVHELTGRVATGLLRQGCSQQSPLLIVAQNSIEHALFMLAGMRVGIPVAPISLAYAAQGSFERLQHLAALSGAADVYLPPAVPDAARANLFSLGLAAVDPQAMLTGAADFGLLEEAQSRVTPDTIAKLMFTSGSTGTPKAVINTHRMLWANQVQIAAVWPSANEKPPVLVDWLPWSHTFGGNFVFNMALWNGGTFCIDDGRPAPAQIGRTIDAITQLRPTRYFNVPTGYEALLPALENNPELVRSAFGNTEFVFCAGAALPQKARDRLSEVLMAALGREIPVVGGWGSTETAPCATAVHFPNKHSSNIGLPLPEVTIKMVPSGGKYELHVKGPNVTPGYWRAAEATAAAFDEEAFYRIGDAGMFLSSETPEAGLVFDGRIAENFKLKTGTWVNVGPLRVAIVDALRPFIQDVVISGHDRDELGVLLFLNERACREALQIESDFPPAEDRRVHAAVCTALAAHNSGAGGSSMRIARYRIERTPPSVTSGEMTDKSYINQRAVLEMRAAAVREMHEDDRFKLENSQQQFAMA